MKKAIEENENEIVKVQAKGFENVHFHDAQFDENGMAEMRQATYKKLCADFAGADIEILGEENNGE
jgi:hypothetical protein